MQREKQVFFRNKFILEMSFFQNFPVLYSKYIWYWVYTFNKFIYDFVQFFHKPLGKNLIKKVGVLISTLKKRLFFVLCHMMMMMWHLRVGFPEHSTVCNSAPFFHFSHVAFIYICSRLFAVPLTQSSKFGSMFIVNKPDTLEAFTQERD